MRRLLVPVLAAALFGLPAVSYAGIDDCPQGVQDARGTQPSVAAIGAELDAAAVAHDVPKQVLRAIAYVESGWRQYDTSGGGAGPYPVLASTDAVCGLGIMQVTADSRYSDADKVRLAEDWEFNVDQGALILAEKWADSQETAPPAGAAPDDKNVLENWYYAICLYNGCGTDATYPTKVANVVADPFRYAPNFAALDPYYFTKPQDVDPSYVFPSAFQARNTPVEEFVFYDHTTGTPTSTVAAPTTLRSEPAAITTGYGAATYGPDATGVTCAQCGGWRLAAGAGFKGRAHWTNTVTGADQSTMTWQPSLAATGPYRVRAYVPAIGTDTLGTATYDVGGTDVPLNQNTTKNAWRSLGDHTLAPGETVVLGDSSAVAGQKIVGDALRVTAIPTLRLARGTHTVTYGSGTTLTPGLFFAGTGFSDDAWRVKLYKRAMGTSAWSYVGAFPVDAGAGSPIPVRPTVNAEYQARWTTQDASYESATSAVTRVYVAPKVTATLSGRTVSARVTPAHAGQRAYLQRLTGSGWQDVTYRTLSSTGTASFAVTPPGPGTFTYRVHKRADADHAAGSSARLTLRA